MTVLMCLLVACGGGEASPDGGEASPDARIADSTPADATWPLPGFGAISGDCWILDDEEWSSESSFIFTNAIDFAADGYDDDDLTLLTDGGQEIIEDGNAGGSSVLSEVFAFEMLQRCEAASLLKTETEIDYDTAGKITDLLVEIDGHKLGVSVTRAYGYPPEDPYTVAQATTLLEGKLADIIASSANVAASDAWVRQILHILAYAPEHAAAVATAYEGIAADLTIDTIVIVTVSEGDDEFIY
jgi:hypothetical protein